MQILYTFTLQLVDFERWKTVLAKSEKSYSGYMSNGIAFRGFPDLLERRHLDVQCNIFAFGVILLEIISGRPPYCKDRGCLVDWVWILLFSCSLLGLSKVEEIKTSLYF